MKKNIFDEVNAKMAAAIEKNSRELAARQSMLSEAEARATEAEAKSVAAVESGDDEAFSAAERMLAQARIDIDMNRKRIDYLKEIPLIPAVEGRVMEKEIKDYLAKEEAADGEKYVKLVAELRSIARGWEERTNSANETIKKLQVYVCKTSNYPTIFSNRAIPNIVRRLVVDPYYRGLTGEVANSMHEVDL